MLDFDVISGFEWDKGNASKNHDKHSVSQKETEEAFFNTPLLTLLDLKHSTNEARYHLLGITNSGRKLHITFTLRRSATLIRVISARDMHKRERQVYDQAS
jgi:uncharacterized protein